MVDKGTIRQVLLDQREESGILLKRCVVKRECEKALASGLSDNLIKVITGVRRCGKSVLAHRVLRGQSYGFVNFDDERLFCLAAGDLNNVLEVLIEITPNMRFILLDEIQNIEGWELFANRLQRQGYVVVLTGSNAHLLSRELATHLTGRHRVYEVYPFSFREYLCSREHETPSGNALSTRERAAVSALFADYFAAGGFPEVSQVVNPRVYLQDLYDRTLTRDIAMRHGVRHIKTLKDVAFYVASNCGGKLTYQNIASAYSLGSLHTAKNYLSYLEDAYLFFAVEAFSFKVKERTRRPRKMYGIDPALIRATVGGSENRGVLLENVVFLELMRRRRLVHYYADPGGKHEVDFVSRDPETSAVELIQVCADLSRAETRERELRGLQHAATAFRNLPDENLLLLTMDHRGEEHIAGRKIACLPVWEWMLQEHPSESSAVRAKAM
jgi:predicted AAA+ superfamily ATPase